MSCGENFENILVTSGSSSWVSDSDVVFGQSVFQAVPDWFE